MSDGGIIAGIRRFFGDPRAAGPAPRRRHRAAETKRTICCFCSCGCGMDAKVRDGQLLYLEGDAENPINEGTLCAKGAAAAGLHTHPDRLTQPMVRRPGASRFEPADWGEALDRVAERLFELRDKRWEALYHRADSLAFLGGAVNTNEEAYLFKKLGVLLGITGIEHQARI